MSKLIRQKVDVSEFRVRPVRDREELLTLLRAKLHEESFELVGATTGGFEAAAIRNEFADVLEVLQTLAAETGFSWQEIEAAAHYKRERLGGLIPGRVLYMNKEQELKFYIASSWRNAYQPEVVKLVRALGHIVYDFREGEGAFGWSQIDPAWQDWKPEEFVAKLTDPIAAAGFARDMDALKEADVTILVCPSGRSAHLEFGYAIGQEQKTILFLPFELERHEPELMYRMAGAIAGDVPALIRAIRALEQR